MRARLGEEGTEQFSVTSCVDGKIIGEQKVHDPFVRTRVMHTLSRWDAFKLALNPKAIKVEVTVSGSHAAQSRIMTLDPMDLIRENAEWEEKNRLRWEGKECGDILMGVNECASS